jgi:hypothetical protein
MTFPAEPLTFTSSLTSSFKRHAQVFSREQRNADKARQVYLNTLAVQAVHFYCECMEIKTDLESGESWNPVTRSLMDVADLAIAGKGRLECRPALPGEEVCLLPAEVQEDRLGYVVVAIDEDAHEATLLGFSPVFKSKLSIHQLASLDDLLDVLVDEVQVAAAELSVGAFGSAVSNIVHLGQWFSNLFDEPWQEPTLVLKASYRSASATQEDEAAVSRRRAKLLKLGDYNVALVLQVMQLPNEDVGIVLRIRPVDSSVLPQGLDLRLLDDSQKVVLETCTGRADNAKELEFEIGRGEVFSVRLSLDEIAVTEHFLS